MKRKLVEQGGTTLMVSLPIKWAKRFNLGKGSEVEVEENGCGLFVSADKETRIKKTQINLKGLDPIVVRILSAYYRAGVDEIEVLYDSDKIIRTIQERLNNEFLGYEIIKQGKNFCLIKNIASALETEFDSTLRRAFLVSLDMANNSLDVVKKKDFESLKNVRGLEAVNNKLTGFCRRVLIKKGYKDYEKTFFMYAFVDELEKIADQYKYLIDYLTKNNIKPGKEVVEVYQRNNELFRDLYKLFYSFKLEDISELYEKRTRLIEDIEKLFALKNKGEVGVLHYLMAITQAITNMSKSVLAIKL